MWKSAAAKTRSFIERGLERYQRGELRDALAQWELALEATPGSAEARALVDFARGQLVPGTDKRSKVKGEPRVTPARSRASEREEGVPFEQQKTPTQGVQLPLQPPPEQKRRPTVVSPISALLAPLTAPEWEKAPPPATRSVSGYIHQDASPRDALEPDDTRPVLDPFPRGDESSATGLDGILLGLGHDEDPTDPDYASVRVEISDRAAEKSRLKTTELIAGCRAEMRAGRVTAAAALAEQALIVSEEAPAPGVADLIAPARKLFEQVFEAHVGPLDTTYAPIFHLEQIGAHHLDARAGFVLSRIEGPVTFEHITDASGMPRFDVLRSVSVLLREGAIKRV